ncbi:hypothetical protein [Streptomyces sp. NPDC002644]
MAYTVYLYNTKTKAVFAQIPYSALTFDQELDASGSCSVTLPIDAPKLDGDPLTPDDLFPVGTGVVISRDDELVWGGILWAYRVDLSTRSLILTARGYLSYFEKRHTDAPGMGNNTPFEQSFILSEFVRYANGLNNTNIGLGTVAQVTNTNVKRVHKYNKYEMQALSDVFENMCDDVSGVNVSTGEQYGGFFLYFEPYWLTPGVSIGNRLRNTANRHPYDSGISLQQAVNCEITEFSVDGTGMCTAAFAVGATDGTASMTPFASDTNPDLLARIPQVNTVLSESSTKVTTALQYKVRSALSFGSAPIILPTIKTYPNLFSPAELLPGMRVPITSDDGFLNLIAADYVITKTATEVLPDGQDRHTLSLIQRELFQETA